MKSKQRLTVAMVCAAGVGVGACGSDDHHEPRTTTAHRPTACRPAVSAALAKVARTSVITVATRPDYGILGCTYKLGSGAHPSATVAVSIDSNPQAFQRFNRAVVETDQNSVWFNNRSRAPRMLSHIGQGADWIPGDGQMLTTDGRVLITIVVAGRTRVAQALAVATARGTLRTRSG